ncbi:MAG: SMC-Scp complex subunit ScpB [Bacteroidota bacterium]
MEPPLSQIVEAIIFTADQPVKLPFIQDVLKQGKAQENGASDTEPVEAPKEGEEKKKQKAAKKDDPFSKKKLEALLEELIEKYQDPQHPFEIRKIAEGYQFFTKRNLYPYVRNAVLNKNKKRLSRSAVETLSIVAYRQPITKAEVEFIRGVSCDYAMQKLLEKKLLSIVGRAEAPGRPLLYATSPFFMEYFGLADMTDLPKLKEFDELEDEHLERFKQHQEAAKEKPEEDHEQEETGETEAGVLEGSGAGAEATQEEAQTPMGETPGQEEQPGPETEQPADPSQAESPSGDEVE